MKNFKKGGGDYSSRSQFGGERKFGGRSNDRGDRGDRGRERPEMFAATCSSCNKGCEVPFRPTGERPVFCRDCFGKKENTPAPRFERNDRPQREFRSEPQHAEKKNDSGIDDVKKQLANLERKINLVLELLTFEEEDEEDFEEEVAPVVVKVAPPTKAVVQKTVEAPKKKKTETAKKEVKKPKAKEVTTKKAKKK
jgi:CxxC-x17-CxxC domain-containing protein